MPRKTITLLLISGLFTTAIADAQQRERRRGGRMSFEEQDKRHLAEGFTGVTTDGKAVPGLFSIKSTGVSTDAVRNATTLFLAALTDEQRARTHFKIDDDEWRKWANQHSYKRQGISFEEMNEDQRKIAFDLLDAGLSARGLKTTKDIMKLNETLAEIKNDWRGYGEWKYHMSVMGEPSKTKPWGWQFDGHHAVINYFVLGDQVVMSPVFIGSEPVVAESGKYKGTVVMQEEQDQGLAFMQSLSKEQQKAATIEGTKSGTNALAEAFKDNLVVDYAGIVASEFDLATKQSFLDLISVFLHHQEKDHAHVKLNEVKKHLDDTYFAWIGGTGDDAVFYYRIQSPVIYIEFDHQRPIGLQRTGVPTRNHIHAVIRTPNGNDYGKDILRQHYEKEHK